MPKKVGSNMKTCLRCSKLWRTLRFPYCDWSHSACSNKIMVMPWNCEVQQIFFNNLFDSSKFFVKLKIMYNDTMFWIFFLGLVYKENHVNYFSDLNLHLRWYNQQVSDCFTSFWTALLKTLLTKLARKKPMYLL